MKFITVILILINKCLEYPEKNQKEKRMKRIKILLTVVSVSFVLFAGCTRIEPGCVGVKVNYYGSDKGMEFHSLPVGMVWYNPFTASVLEYPTFVQQVSWTKENTPGSPTDESITFNSIESIRMNVDVGIAYHLDKEAVPAFYAKFRTSDLRGFTHGYLHNIARDAFNAVACVMKVEDINGPLKEELLAEAKKKISQTLASDGVIIDQVTFISDLRPPQNVIDSINAKVGATQDAIRVENEIRQAKAEAEKKVAEAEGDGRSILTRAEAQAKANKKIADSIDEKLIQYEAVKKWDGKLPQVTSGGTVPFINIPTSGNVSTTK